MRIYWFEAPAPRRVLALAKHLGIDAEFVEIDLMAGGLGSPEYAALNPNRKAPTLVDGELVCWESSAIMAHLCGKAGSNMWPASDPSEQVEVLRWLSWNESHWAPATGPFIFEHVIKARFGMGPPDRSSLEAKVADVLKFGKVLDDHLAHRSHVACGRLTIADFQLASMATEWREAELPVEKFANLRRWIDGLMRIPAWADPWPVESDDSVTKAHGEQLGPMVVTAEPGSCLDIRRDDARAAHVADLLALHLRELGDAKGRYDHALDANALSGPNVTFWTAWLDGDLVGLGALKQLDASHGELKSMRTAPQALGRGVGRAMLAHIVAEAKSRGYERLSLETGTAPLYAPAVNLYRKAGFRSCGPFSEYRPSPHSQFFTAVLNG